MNALTTIPHAPAERCGRGSSNRYRRAKAYGNTPARESDESSLEEIAVVDPHHPLLGRKFKVIRRVGGNRGTPSYEVEYLGTYRLLVPIASTESSAAVENHTKLSLEGLNDLILTVELIENGDDRSGQALGAAAGELATSDCGRAGGDTSGDAP